MDDLLVYGSGLSHWCPGDMGESDLGAADLTLTLAISHRSYYKAAAATLQMLDEKKKRKTHLVVSGTSIVW